MAKVWVRAKGVIYVNENGQRVTKHAGEWAEVGKHQARMLVASGQAEIPKQDTRNEVQEYDQCGVRVRIPLAPLSGHIPRSHQADSIIDTSAFGDLADKLIFTQGEPAITHNFTIIWKPPSLVVPCAVETGLARLHSFEDTDAEPWEMVAILASETEWADSFGSDEERAKTEDAIGDLRIPVYDVNMLWVRKTERTEAVIARWLVELRQGADEQHAFLRALYAEHVLMCTLPANWVGKHREWH